MVLLLGIMTRFTIFPAASFETCDDRKISHYNQGGAWEFSQSPRVISSIIVVESNKKIGGLLQYLLLNYQTSIAARLCCCYSKMSPYGRALFQSKILLFQEAPDPLVWRQDANRVGGLLKRIRPGKRRHSTYE